MMLTYVSPGHSGQIARISGKDEVRKHLSGLGFVAGATVTVISQMSGNMILNVKDSRVAIDQGMARRIFIKEGTEV